MASNHRGSEPAFSPGDLFVDAEFRVSVVLIHGIGHRKMRGDRYPVYRMLAAGDVFEIGSSYYENLVRTNAYVKLT